MTSSGLERHQASPFLLQPNVALRLTGGGRQALNLARTLFWKQSWPCRRPQHKGGGGNGGLVHCSAGPLAQGPLHGGQTPAPPPSLGARKCCKGAVPTAGAHAGTVDVLLGTP